MSGRLEGKIALITGAAGGLGQAMARRMAEEGAKLALTDIDEAGARALADAINADHPGAAFAYAHDVTDESQWIDVIEQAVADLGGLSVLVNNAGIGGELKPVVDCDLDAWRRMQAINVESVMLGC